MAVWNTASFHTHRAASPTVTWVSGGSGTGISSTPNGPAPSGRGPCPA